MAAVAESSGDQLARREAEVEYRRDVRDLVDLLSKLNPCAKEFVPSSVAGTSAGGRRGGGRLSADAPLFVSSSDFYRNWIGYGYHVDGNVSGIDRDARSERSFRSHQSRRMRNAHGQRRWRSNENILGANIEDCIRRTVYVSDIDQHVTEQELAGLFGRCGPIHDCRVCGDPHSVLRFAFIEFDHEYSAKAALSFGGTMLGFYPLRVLPSKTAILPVNPQFLPQDADEADMVRRTIYCTNIDKQVTQTELKGFFQSTCGQVSRLRLLGDNVHSTRIAFVEFVQADCAIVALNCSGMLLRALPIRVSPSKTPVRPRNMRPASQ